MTEDRNFSDVMLKKQSKYASQQLEKHVFFDASQILLLTESVDIMYLLNKVKSKDLLDFMSTLPANKVS